MNGKRYGVYKVVFHTYEAIARAGNSFPLRILIRGNKPIVLESTALKLQLDETLLFTEVFLQEGDSSATTASVQYFPLAAEIIARYGCLLHLAFTFHSISFTVLFFPSPQHRRLVLLSNSISRLLLVSYMASRTKPTSDTESWVDLKWRPMNKGKWKTSRLG